MIILGSIAKYHKSSVSVVEWLGENAVNPPLSAIPLITTVLSNSVWTL